MNKNDEYESLVSERDSTQAKHDASQRRIDGYTAQLDRLYPIKEIISTQKGNFDTLRKNTDKVLDAERSWKGVNYDTYITEGGWLSDENVAFRDKSLDLVLDSLNNRITEIENLRNDEFGILGNLVSALNSLCNKIENFFN